VVLAEKEPGLTRTRSPLEKQSNWLLRIAETPQVSARRNPIARETTTEHLPCLSESVFVDASLAQTGLKKVNHIIIVMQENRSFDNYFGARPYTPGVPYHSPSGTDGCALNDPSCVDGLSCRLDATGSLHCFNSNLDDNGSQVSTPPAPVPPIAPNFNQLGCAPRSSPYRPPNLTTSPTSSATTPPCSP
jgi:Phosphoesterase family